MRRFAIPLLATFVLAVGGCGSSSSPTSPDGGGGGAGMSATINGASWSASPTPAVVYRGNILALAGLNLSSYGVTFAVGQITTTGTYSLAYLNQQGSSGIVSNTSGGGWDTYAIGGTGSITFTTFTTNHIVGTFAFDAIATTGNASGTLHVTNGKFDVTY